MARPFTRPRRGPGTWVILALLFATPLSVFGQSQQDLSLAAAVEKIVTNDPNAGLSATSAYSSYRVEYGKALPQATFSLSPGYGVETTETPTLNLLGAEVDSKPTKNQSIGAAVNLTQLLPSAGTLTAGVQDTMVVTVLGSGDSATTTIDQSPKLSVSISQPILVNGRLLDLRLFPATLRSFQIGYDKARQKEVATRNSTIYQGVSNYFSIVNLRRQISYLEGSVGALETRQKQLEVTRAQGGISDLDLRSAAINVEKAKESVLEARYSLVQSEAALARSMGVPAESDTALPTRNTAGSRGTPAIDGMKLDPTVPEIQVTNSEADLYHLISTRNPDVIQAMLDAENARLQQTIAGQQYGGTLTASFSVQPNYGYDRANSDQLGSSFSELFNTDHHSYNDVRFSLGVTIPLYQGGQSVENRSALSAQRTIAERSLGQTLDQLRDQLHAAFAKRDYLARKVAYLSDDVDLQKQRVADQERLLALNAATDLDVTNARLDLTESQNALLQAKSDQYLANLSILSLTGSDLAQYTLKGNTE